MAEEVQANKRKYDDQIAPPSSGGRRATGFSAPIASQSPDPSRGPPPVDDIQLAKQRAQEIAARLFNNVEAKRPRVDNGRGGFDSSDSAGYGSDPVQKPLFSNVTPSSIPVSYSGFPASSKKIDIPNGRVGVIIGKGGETIKYLQQQSGAKIQVTRDMDADPYSQTRMVELMGTPEQIAKAEQLITDVLAEAEAGGSGTGSSRRVTGPQAGSDQFVMKVPSNKVGLVIGKGGETIKNMQARSGARIQVIPLHLPPGDTSTERSVQIDGTSEQIEAAKQLVYEVTSENRLRNPAMSGGYTQQGYEARPPTSWAPPGPPTQQPGYGYVQPGYGASQPPYGGYTQPTSGGYATGWDQTDAPANPTSQPGGYDYYSQLPTQQQQAAGGTPAPADNTGYSCTQPPASGYNQGQGYSQDGYGYSQPQPTPLPGYDQQQGYNTTPGYGAQGDTTQTAPSVQPSPNPASYPPQGSTQPGYGVPPPSQAGYGTQPPSGYGGPGYGPPQALKAPASQSAYGQPGYPQSQPPPAQSGYGTATAQPGYAQPPYGALPVNQMGYGQQPYGGGYSQAPVYSADGSSGGGARGSYDASPASQTVQPSGVAKASPQG